MIQMLMGYPYIVTSRRPAGVIAGLQTKDHDSLKATAMNHGSAQTATDPSSTSTDACDTIVIFIDKFNRAIYHQ
jgi:hypothetical protein